MISSPRFGGIWRSRLGTILGLAVVFTIALSLSADAQVWRRSTDRNIRNVIARLQLNLQIDDRLGSILMLDRSPDGRYLAQISDDRRPRVWDLDAGRQLPPFPPLSSQPRRMMFAHDGSALVMLTDDGEVTVWDLATQELRQRVTSAAGANGVALSPDGTLLAYSAPDGRVVLLRRGRAEPVAVLKGHAEPPATMAFGPSGQFLVSADRQGSIRVWEVNSGTEVRQWRNAGGAVTAVRFAADETEVLSMDALGLSLWRGPGEVPAFRSVASGTMTDDFDLSKDASSVAMIVDGAVVLVPLDGKAAIRRQIPGHKATAVRYDVESRRVFASAEDGLTRVIDIASGEVVVSLVSTGESWAVLDRDGRFDGSQQALQSVKWLSDTLSLPLNSFSESQFEPGLLSKKRLGDSNLLTAGIENFAEGILPPPSSVVEGLNVQPDGSLTFGIAIEDQGGGIDSVRVFHNGKAVAPASMVAAEATQTSRRYKVRIPAVAGQNGIVVAASSSERVLGAPARDRIEVNLPFRKPTLHVLAIGINRYGAAEYNLDYARPDAEGIVKTLRAASTGLFGDVRLLTLFDNQANASGIEAALTTLASSDPEDVVVIYIASHGTSDGDGYFLLPADFPYPPSRTRLAESALSFERIRDALLRIPAQRVTLLIDACKSGTAVAAVQEQVSRRALHRLGAAVGLHIISATAKDQLAVELPQLGHGVFGYSLINALSGKADRNPADGKVTISELSQYVEAEVPKLSKKYTEYRHWPTIFSSGLDFSISSSSGK